MPYIHFVFPGNKWSYFFHKMLLFCCYRYYKCKLDGTVKAMATVPCILPCQWLFNEVDSAITSDENWQTLKKEALLLSDLDKSGNV